MRYKEQLSTDHTTLSWARVQRLRMRFLVEDRLRHLAKSPWVARVRSAVAPTHIPR